MKTNPVIPDPSPELLVNLRILLRLAEIFGEEEYLRMVHNKCLDPLVDTLRDGKPLLIHIRGPQTFTVNILD